MRVVTILARHGVDRYPRAEQEIAELFKCQLPDVERDVIIVDNAVAPGTVTRAAGVTLLGADNRVREFTAFDRAIEWVGPVVMTYDLVHLATSAFNMLYTAYLERFTPAVLRAIAAAGPACVGHIDCYNERVRIGPFVSQHWIRTCFFLLPPAQVRALGSFVSVSDGAAFFSGDPSAPFRADAPLCSTYRRYIVDWLTGRDIGQGVSWHSRFALTQETLASFESKALSILNEQMLGIRLRALGCPLVDVTWLSARAAVTTSDDIPWSLPWQQQLANRDRDAVTIGT